MSQLARPLSRQEAKLVTRQRLLQAAMSILLEKGREALTTGAVTRIVGVAQPTFYVHFPDMETLLEELATDIVDKLRKSLREARQPLRGAPDVVAASRESFRISIRACIEHEDLLRVFLSEQYRPASTLGVCAQTLFSEIRDELVADVAELPFTAGLKPDQLTLIAEGIVSLILQFGLALAEKRQTDEEAVVNLLAHATMALVMSMPRG
ncbi:MAG TPA: TetR/AcrR family transcriptional regulator [Aquabacterium sp.]|uniref:TetR/AcrR family transcriptional regulator n=1 Tax=Aquabacterium sp. TaxID=1872578 RepID=UPI002E3559F1|nr:TetR/AcrR family transcriptional regulator [Aquabacterium sp.]HEX5357242.1 TetR/AcrR family transcriptional regulator [Aquabacterium sp.]